MKQCSILLLFIVLSMVSFAQEVARPQMWGIAKMTFLVSNYEMAREYYGRFLGFDEAFSYNSELGTVLSFKVNDRQFLEFVEDDAAENKQRLISYSIETDDVEQMRMYLQQKGVEVPEKITVDGAGNEVFLVHDNSGVPLEFIKLTNRSLHKKSKGKYLSDNRISERIHHAGLYCDEVLDNDSFYVGILGFKELWRYPENRDEKVMMNYYQIPDCVENIEHYRTNDKNFNHPCFLVDDMQETIYTLKERRGENILGRPMVGKGNRWLLNIKNTDGTKVEFTEMHTVR
ncbi:VOC family protein [uncultured Draconibacterium sp.]|uniref:VOC family protein n=1 Tax=uncultured Draconibacterium sp. TaxID=1573823 RepID=UPI0032177228